MTLENEPWNLFESKSNTYKGLLIDIDRAQKEAEHQLNHDLTVIVDDIEKQAHKNKKLAVCRILSIVEKGYSENCDKNNEELQELLNACLQEGIAEVMAPLFDKMGKDLENRLNHIRGSYLKLITQLIENIHRQAVDLLNLSWEGELETPSITSNLINFTVVSSKQKASTPPEFGLLPDSILNTLVLLEVKKLVPIEVEKSCVVWQYYYQDYLQKTSIRLKNVMGTMIEAAKNMVQPQLDMVLEKE